MSGSIVSLPALEQIIPKHCRSLWRNEKLSNICCSQERRNTYPTHKTDVRKKYLKQHQAEQFIAAITNPTTVLLLTTLARKHKEKTHF